MKIGGMLLTGEKLILLENMLFRWHQFTIMSKGLNRDQNRAFAVTGRRLATGDIV
jgi:hypothetical protein